MVFRTQSAGSWQVHLSAAKSDPCTRRVWMYFVEWAYLKTPSGSGTTLQRGWKSGHVLEVGWWGIHGSLQQGAWGKVEKHLGSSASCSTEQPWHYRIFSRLRLSKSYVSTSIQRGWHLLPKLREAGCLGPNFVFLRERSLGCKHRGKSDCYYPGNISPANRKDSNLQDHGADALTQCVISC